MEEKQNNGKTPAQTVFVFSKAKIKIFSTRIGLSLYSAQISKNTKILIIHVGQNWKKSQKESQKGKKKKKKNRLQFSHPAKIFQASISLPFLLFFSSDFRSAMLSSTRILRALIDSTNLALIASKKYKISHKMRSVE